MATFVTGFIFLLASLLPHDVQMEKTCSKDVINPYERLDCGWLGISKDLCESPSFNKGRCCYDDSVEGVPYCFHGATDNKKDCETNSEEREDCGYYGINKEKCLDKNYHLGLCCWDESVENVPWCFYGVKRQLLCSKDVLRPEDRADCGWVGITKEQCESNYGGRCCYEESELKDVPWCFFGIPGV